MTDFILASLFGIASLFLVAFGINAALVRWGGWQGRDAFACAAGFAAAPVLVGLMAWPMLALGVHGPLLAAAPGLACAPVMWFAGFRRPPIRELLAPFLEAPAFVRALLLVMCIAVIVQSMTIAISENDALEYIIAGRIMAGQGGIWQYPFVTPDPQTGYYAPSLHPPVFHTLIAFAYRTTPDASLVLLRLACAIALLSSALLVGLMASHRGRAAPGVAAVMVLATPVLVAMSLSFNSDAIRIAAVVAALAGVIVASEIGTLRATVTAGVLTAVAMWAHSAGLVAPAIGVVTLLAGRLGRNRLKVMIGYIATIVVAGGGWYAINALGHGAIISDTWPAAEWPALAYIPDMLARRGLDTTWGMFIHGGLQAFTDPALMGIAFWLSALGLITGILRSSHTSERIALVAVFGFLALASAMALTGHETMIKNIRYVMTVAPFAALLAGIVLAEALNARVLLAIPAALACVLVAAWSLAGMALRGYGLSSIAPVLGQSENWARMRDRVPGGPLLDRLEGASPGLVLTFRQGDMAHLSNARWLDHFNPALADIHTAAPEDAAAWLASRDVRFAYVPAQTPVTLTRSALGLMLADPRYARPLAQHRGTRLFALGRQRIAPVCRPIRGATLTTTYRGRSTFEQLADLARLPQIAAFGIGVSTSADASLPVVIGAQGNGNAELRVDADAADWARIAFRASGTALFELSAEIIETSGRQRRQPLLNGLIPPEPHLLAAQVRAEPGERISAFFLTRPSAQSGTIEIDGVDVCVIDRD